MRDDIRKWTLAGLLGVLAAGCAPTRERVPDEGERYSFRTAHTPYAAAICIARNARARAGLNAEERTVGDSSTEVIVRAGGGQTLASARIDNEGTFSRASILVTPQVRSDREGFARQLMQGC